MGTEERFSKIKLIKSRLQGSMIQSRLSKDYHCSFIESEKSLDFSRVVEKFAATEYRRALLVLI